MVQQPDVYVGANPGGMPAIGRWLKAELDSGDIPAARKEHIIQLIERSMFLGTEVEIDETTNVLRVTVTIDPTDQLISTLRAMGWNE